MADEIKINLSAILENGQLKEQVKPSTINITQTTLGAHSPVVTVGTTSEALPFGDVATSGIMFLENLEPTTTGNSILIGPESTASALIPYQTLRPKHVHIVQITTGVTVRIQASASTVKMKVTHWQL